MRKSKRWAAYLPSEKHIVNVDVFFRSMAFTNGRPPRTANSRMKDRSPFGIAGLWENWKDPATGEWTRTFAILTTPANDLVARTHDRMPAILNPTGYDRWLGIEPDPHDLLVPSPSELLAIWPISKRVNSPDNDDERLLDEFPLSTEPAA